MIGIGQLVDTIGLDAALKLVAGWGGSTLYIPDKYDPHHLISKVLGEDVAIKLEMEYGGQTMTVPKVSLHHIKLEVNIIKLVAKGFSPREAGHILGVSHERAKQIARKHRRSDKNCHKNAGDPDRQIVDGAADPRNTARDKKRPVSYQPI